MRISTSVQFDTGLRTMTSQQAEILKLQQQISSNRRVLSPSDDPIAAAREVTLSNRLMQSEQMVRNQDDVRGQLKLVEGYMTTAKTTLQSFQTKMVQAGNSALSDSDRQSLVAEMETMLKSMIDLGNTQDESGNYVFSGFKVGTQPFVKDGAGTVTYNGDTGVREIQVGANRTIAGNMTGNYLFFDIETGTNGLTSSAAAGNTGTGFLSNSTIKDSAAWKAETANAPFTVNFLADGDYEILDGAGAQVSTGNMAAGGGSISYAGVTLTMTGTPADGDSFEFGVSGKQDLFTSMQNVIDALKTPDGGNGAARANLLRQGGEDVARGFDRIVESLTTLGARQNELDALTTQDKAAADNTTEAITKATGLDAEGQIAAVSELTQRQLSLSAAQKIYTQVSTMSLFDLI